MALAAPDGHPAHAVRLTRRLAGLTPVAIHKVAAGWEKRSAELHRIAEHPPHLRQFLCIHRYEGSWTDTGAPYYGGLQMDVGFQQHYGRWLYAQEGNGRPLVAARADLDGGESPQEQGFLALAEHGEVLRAAVAHRAGTSVMTSS